MFNLLCFLVGATIAAAFLLMGYDILTWQYWVFCIPLCVLVGALLNGLGLLRP